MNFVVEDSEGIVHVARKGRSGVVGFTLCKQGFKLAKADRLTHWPYMRLAARGASCVRCLAEDHG